jgi:GxxExxY protein
MINITELKKHIYDVIGALHEVHKELGPGLNEYCYQEGLQLQFEEQRIPYKREVSFHPKYHGKEMQALYRIDFLCKDDIIVECKSISEIDNNARAQLFNYMRLLKCPCGILVNFAKKSMDIERYFYDSELREIIGMKGNIFHL